MIDKSMHLRLAQRLVLLFALVLTLGYLKSPARSYALTCTQECLAWEHTCVQDCGGSSSCSNECILEYKSCVDGCPR
jgi:hypothetical protein